MKSQKQNAADGDVLDALAFVGVVTQSGDAVDGLYVMPNEITRFESPAKGSHNYPSTSGGSSELAQRKGGECDRAGPGSVRKSVRKKFRNAWLGIANGERINSHYEEYDTATLTQGDKALGKNANLRVAHAIPFDVESITDDEEVSTQKKDIEPQSSKRLSYFLKARKEPDTDSDSVLLVESPYVPWFHPDEKMPTVKSRNRLVKSFFRKVKEFWREKTACLKRSHTYYTGASTSYYESTSQSVVEVWV